MRVKADELASSVGLKDYATVAMALERFETKIRKDSRDSDFHRKAFELLIVKMRTSTILILHVLQDPSSSSSAYGSGE
jgi:hypothetical protein